VQYSNISSVKWPREAPALKPEMKITIEQFASWQNRLLGIALIERMFPNYALFSQLSEEGDAQTYKNITQLIWESCLDSRSVIDFSKQQDKLEVITPNPDKFDMYGVWPALDACVGLDILLGFCIEEDGSALGSLVDLYYSTIESYLSLQSDENELTHPLVMDADNYISKVCESLQGNENNRTDSAKTVKALVKLCQTSNLGLVLDD
jgi:uncharacterized protein YjaG (DUF416 family)